MEHHDQYDGIERLTSPRSSTVSELSESESWRKQSLVGKIWEIYWTSPETQNSGKSVHSSPDESPASTDVEEESAFDSDWYDAHVKSYLAAKDLFEVSFVGEENIVHLMKLEQQIVRPLEATSPKYYCPRSDEEHDEHAYESTKERLPQHQIDQRWTEFLIDKCVEIFWESTCDTSADAKGPTAVGNDEDDSFTSDWYDAHIDSFNSQTGLFQVSFVGEKIRYDMALSQANVRPSTRAWVRRARFLLDLRIDTVLGIDSKVISWEELLKLVPHSTSCFENEQVANAIDQRPFTVTLYQDLLRDQLNLKKELQFVPSEEEGDNSNRKHIIPNSRDHVEHLAGCIQLALDASTWLEHHQRGFSREGITRLYQKLDLKEIHSHIFNGFTLFLRSFVFHCDERPTVHNTKRIHAPSPLSSSSKSSKRAKKRRLSVNRDTAFSRDNRALIDFEYLKAEVAHCERLDEGWIEVLNYLNTRIPENGKCCAQQPSSGLVKFVLQQFSVAQSPRYLSLQLSISLQYVQDRLWSRIENWICQAKLAVGQRYAEVIPTMEQFQCDEIDLVNKRCSLDAIHICIKESQDNDLLRKVDLDEILQWLLQIRSEVLAFQTRAWETIAKGMSADVNVEDTIENDCSRENLENGDIVLTELCTLIHDKACPQKSMVVENCNSLTMETLEIALTNRKWIILDQHIRNNRERVKSIEEAYCQRPTRILHIPSTHHGDCGPFLQNTITEYIEKLLAHAQKVAPINWNEIQSESDCHKVIAQIFNEHILLEDEEKAAVLSDAFAWSNRAKALLGEDHALDVDFQSIESLYKELLSLKKGKSKTRLATSKGLLRQPMVDTSISAFAKQQIFLRFGDIELQVVECYTNGSAWFKKVNQIFRALHHYGNTNVHVSNNVSTKVNNMIELPVIEDLVKEHEKSVFNFPGHAAALSTVSNDANTWVQVCLSLLSCASASPLDPKILLNSLQKHSAHRPKGIVMFPSRQLVSEWTDLLDWYCQCSLAFDVLRKSHETKASASGEMTEESSILVQIVNTNTKVEELLLKGANIMSTPSSKEYDSTSCSFVEVDVSMIMETLKVHFTETITPFSLAKINQHWQSTTLFSALKAHDGTLEHRGNFFLLKLFVWKHAASNILNKVEKCSGRRGKNHSAPSPEEAKAVLRVLQNLPKSFEDLSKKDHLLASVYSTKYSPLSELIGDTEKVSKDISMVLKEMSSPNLLITKEYIEVASTMLKNVRASIKTVNENGLGIDSAKASAVEKYIRDFNWLKSTFACPVLRDAKYSSSRRGVNTSDASFEAFSLDESRISLSFFLQIYEKATSRCRSGETLTSLDSEMNIMWGRISIIKNQISQWQAEVHTYIPRALRLSARRISKSRSLIDEECDIVSESELRKFLQHPLLRYISMPEEDVIREALAFTTSMAERMMVIFGRDHHGKDVDRSAIPQYASLLGNTGEFYLFRVVQSPEYLELKAELEGMECYSNSLPVRTLDKVTYSWITKLVKWIESVANAVVVPDKTESTLVQSCIPLNESINLINEGQYIFLGLPEESKKYLLDLRLSVNVRPSTGKIHVKNCKGGSNHSIGCTVLKWVAFCYNGLRNDLASTEFWMKRVDAALGNKKLPNAITALKTFLEEAINHLVIAPDDDVLEELVSSISECSPVLPNEETIINSEMIPVFEHNLLMHVYQKKEMQAIKQETKN